MACGKSGIPLYCESIPMAKTVRIQSKIEPGVHRRLVAAAKVEGRTLSSMIAWVLGRFVAGDIYKEGK
jgi:hypothetical protein